MCLKGWFSEDVAGVKKHYKEVIKNRLSKTFHPSISGRYFATRLLYAHSTAGAIDPILAEMLQLHASIKQKTPQYALFPYFEYMVAPVLFMTGHPEEALYYINYSLHHFPSRFMGVTQSVLQTMNLTKALTLAKTGGKKEAEKLHRQIHPSKFGFLLKKTNIIQYIFLSQYLNKSNAKSDQQLKDLIRDTGFTALKKILVDDARTDKKPFF